MPTLATWLRDSDEAPFAPWLTRRADVQTRNARHLGSAIGLELLAGMDGLLLSGGPDISAGFLRHQTLPADAPIEEDAEPERDAWEFAAVVRALERGLPIFAVCKGHQVLNVALGGSLLLDIRGHDDPADRFREVQPLRYDASAPGGRRYERVNSSHHQAVDRLGDGLLVEAWHAGDGTIEQMRLRDYAPGCVGVQYHPERGAQYAGLFDDFLARVATAATAGTGARGT